MPSRVDVVVYLRALPLFGRLGNAELFALADAVAGREVPAGTTITREGEHDPCVYFILEGVADVTRGETHLASLGSGEFFGEMAVLEDAPRSATVRARTAMRLLRLGRPQLLRAMRRRPAIAIAMCQTLSARVRSLNARLESAKR